MPNRAIAALTEILRPEIDLGKSRLENTVSDRDRHGERAQRDPPPIACERPGAVQTASTYRRLQRVFQHVRLGEHWALPLIIGVLGQHGPWLPARDRTTWPIGKRKVNFLVLARVTRRFRGPLLWTVIERRGCSDTAMHMTLIKRYLAHFPATTIRMLLADRDFAGVDWVEFLCETNTPLAIRIRDTLRITTEDGHADCAKLGEAGSFEPVSARAKTPPRAMRHC